MKHKINQSTFLAFAKKNAGKYFKTVAQDRPFMVDVIDNYIVCYPESKERFWLTPSVQLKRFNQTNSLHPGDYPSEMFTNSYFVGLVSAMIKGTKPIPPPVSCPAAPLHRFPHRPNSTKRFAPCAKGRVFFRPLVKLILQRKKSPCFRSAVIRQSKLGC